MGNVNTSRSSVALAAALLLASGLARSGDAPASDLPAPTRICDGGSPRLSPSGTRLLIVRSGLDLEVRDANRQPGTAEFAWVRDLATGREVRSPRSGEPVAFDGDDILVYADGTGVRLPGGERVTGYAKRPVDFGVSAEVWSSDGRRYAYVPRPNTPQDYEAAGPGKEWGIHLVEGDGASRYVPSPTRIEADSEGRLVFSRDGGLLFFHAVFLRNGNLPSARAGVLELATGMYTLLGEGVVGRPAGWGFGGAGFPFDARGRRVAFAMGTTPDEADVWTATVDGAAAQRRTADGGNTWGASLSPDGERVAYWRQDGDAPRADDERGPAPRLHVVALRADVAWRSASGGPVHGAGDLLWLPDGRGLLFASDGVVWRQDLPEFAAPPPTAPVVTRTRSRIDEVTVGLRSRDQQREEWALGEIRRRGAWDPAFVRPLRELLARAAIEHVYHAMTVVEILWGHDVLEAVPELVGVLRHDAEYVREFALRALLQWNVREVEPTLRALREDAPWPETRPYIDAALARFGAEDAWASLAKACEDPVDDVREAAVNSLGGLKDPRAVDLLIARLADTGHYMEAPKKDIGDLAASSLSRVTGQKFGRDSAAWTTWWSEVGRRLPVASPDGRGAPR